jgi:hypothetical protein
MDITNAKSKSIIDYIIIRHSNKTNYVKMLGTGCHLTITYLNLKFFCHVDIALGIMKEKEDKTLRA